MLNLHRYLTERSLPNKTYRGNSRWGQLPLCQQRFDYGRENQTTRDLIIFRTCVLQITHYMLRCLTSGLFGKIHNLSNLFGQRHQGRKNDRDHWFCKLHNNRSKMADSFQNKLRSERSFDRHFPLKTASNLKITDANSTNASKSSWRRTHCTSQRHRWMKFCWNYFLAGVHRKFW